MEVKKGMISRKLTALMAFLLVLGTAYAANPTVVVLNRDMNYYYPSGGTVDIEFTIADSDAPADANLSIAYILDGDIATNPRVYIIDMNGEDGNIMNYCDDIIQTAAQTCTYTWTLPSGLDANYVFDVNVFDITTGDDVNESSLGQFYIDTNGCTTQHIQNATNADQYTLESACSGYGTTSTIYWGRSRQGRCPDNLSTYTSAFTLTFGVFNVCYYSIDNLGNTETTKGFVHTADSDALDIALLTELALAGLLLFVVLGAVILRREDLTGPMMIALVSAAVIIAISIVIFATVL